MASTLIFSRFFLPLLLFILIVEFSEVSSRPPKSAFMRELIKKNLLYRATNGRRGLSRRAIRALVKRRMLALSRVESSAERLAIECPTNMKDVCTKMFRGCNPSILVKRSIDSESQAQHSYWYDTINGKVTELDDLIASHHVTKRSSGSRKIRISCPLCRRKCWGS